MLRGSKSFGNSYCSGIPSWPVGILMPSESHLRPSRLPHFCPTREAAVPGRLCPARPRALCCRAVGGSRAGWAVHRSADVTAAG
jgi:hypothetical protein